MKIVQTLWLNKLSTPPIHCEGGWLAPEYHWMSWALSCLQLKKFYSSVNLYANSPAVDLLIDQINLPYTEVYRTSESLDIPDKAWALAKVHTYSLQRQPFLHVDGDVFIWERFSKRYEQSQLVSQNIEIGFPFYSYFLELMQKDFTYIPAVFQGEVEPSVNSCNAGVFGGTDTKFFQLYAIEAIKFVRDNVNFIDLVDPSVLCMTFEQLLFYRLAQKHQKIIEYVHTTPVYDVTYPGFANFYEVPHKQKFIHTMGEFKRKKYVCDHLARRLRKDHPVYYYRILKCCQEAGLSLTSHAYSLEELSPVKHPFTYFENLTTAYIKGELKPGSWLYFYAKDVFTYERVETLFSLNRNALLNQTLIFDNDCKITEVYEPDLKQTLISYDINSLSIIKTELDGLNMLVLDACLTAKSIKGIIKEVGVYFDSKEITENGLMFQNLILDRIRDILYLGGLQWKQNK